MQNSNTGQAKYTRREWKLMGKINKNRDGDWSLKGDTFSGLFLSPYRRTFQLNNIRSSALKV